MENDFGEYYKTFSLPEGKDKYDLVYTDVQKEGFSTDQVIFPRTVDCNEKANDATPCGALGYGKGNGLP